MATSVARGRAWPRTTPRHGASATPHPPRPQMEMETADRAQTTNRTPEPRSRLRQPKRACPRNGPTGRPGRRNGPTGLASPTGRDRRVVGQ